MSPGVVRSVKNLVVRVEFDEAMPAVNELLEVAVGDTAVQLLVSSLQPGIAVCLNIQADSRLQKGMTVTPTGRSVEVPVGD
ncbi:MAG TPA: hypothetical protein VFH39_03430, partial [Candidatus Saccharimonadales bacterium]|nr:hypothetical protein [Candidatus Saccharimonadales bacterium]